MNKRFKIGVIGCGGMGARHVDTIKSHKGFEFVAGCDINNDILKSLPDNVATYSDAAELFRNHELDIVSLILPNYLYEPMVKLAASHGINVFCEKPLGKDLDSCQTIVQTLKKANLQGWVSGQRKYISHFLRAKSVIEKIKPAFSYGIFTYYWRPAFNNIQWRGDRAKSGGIAVIDSGWHALDLLHWFIGAPENVSAELTYLEKYADIDDKAVIQLSYPGNAMANLLISYTLPPGRFEFTFANGQKSLYIDLEKYQYYEDGLLVEEVKQAADDDPFEKMYDELYKGLCGETSYLTDVSQAEQIMTVVDACYR